MISNSNLRSMSIVLMNIMFLESPKINQDWWTRYYYFLQSYFQYLRSCGFLLVNRWIIFKRWEYKFDWLTCVGSVWIFSAYESVQFVTLNDFYCQPEFYKFAFATLIIQYVFLALILLGSPFLAYFLYYKMKAENAWIS